MGRQKYVHVADVYGKDDAIVVLPQDTEHQGLLSTTRSQEDSRKDTAPSLSTECNPANTSDSDF